MDQNISVTKIFGIDVAPTDIKLSPDGSVIIKNPLLSTIVSKAQEKIIKDLVENPSRALENNKNYGCNNNIGCAV